MTSFNFRAYLKNYEILQVIGTNKTRKQFKNFLMVLYGKKKDRGHIKSKVERYIQDQHEHLAQLHGAVGRVLEKYAPGIGSIMGGPYGWL